MTEDFEGYTWDIRNWIELLPFEEFAIYQMQYGGFDSYRIRDEFIDCFGDVVFVIF
jgi:hypothetical protein